MIDWSNITREDAEKIHIIATRAAGAGFGKLINIDMNISACHSCGCPLDLDKLRDFSAADFAHDIAGIDNNINRSTGKLENCFLPRAAAAAEL